MHALTPMPNPLRLPAKYKCTRCIMHIRTNKLIHKCGIMVVECTEWHINDASKPRAGPRSPENTAAPHSPRLSLYLSRLLYFSLTLANSLSFSSLFLSRRSRRVSMATYASLQALSRNATINGILSRDIISLKVFHVKNIQYANKYMTANNFTLYFSFCNIQRLSTFSLSTE